MNRPYSFKLDLTYWKPLEFAGRRTYRNLKKAWIGFKLAKQEGNHDKMKYYAEGIRKFQRQLGLTVSPFSDVLLDKAVFY